MFVVAMVDVYQDIAIRKPPVHNSGSTHQKKPTLPAQRNKTRRVKYFH
jgi:hypothetical protein